MQSNATDTKLDAGHKITMKEIDFLPEWYKSTKRRQVNYRVQYIILSGAFAVMMVWNFVAANSISKVQAKYLEMKTEQGQSERVSAKLAQYKNKLSLLHEQEKVLENIDSKISVSNVLAEISFLVDKKIVLNKVELISEIIGDKQNNKQSVPSLSVVRTAGSSFGNTDQKHVGNICFKVLISGVAADGRDVAALLCELEDSPYFRQVDLSYSRDAEVKTKRTYSSGFQQDIKPELLEDRGNNRKSEENLRVSEFEIICYLSNYRQE